MKRIDSFDEIPRAVTRVRSHGKAYLTNFFPDEFRTNLWIKHNMLFEEDFGNTVIFLRKNSGFSNLYFITSDVNSFYEITREKFASAAEIYVMDIVGRGSVSQEISDGITKDGFSRYTSLSRMNRLSKGFIDTEDKTEYAGKSQSLQIHSMLSEFFDPLAEQLPMEEEISALINDKKIIICCDNNSSISGFLIFEIHGLTSYLRYWFVHPDHRDKKIGSVLLNRYFKESANTVRQNFWVIDSNENAIKRYMHYGFTPEDMHDIVLINKKMSYGGKSNKDIVRDQA